MKSLGGGPETMSALELVRSTTKGADNPVDNNSAPRMQQRACDLRLEPVSMAEA